jgi:hypothetical protein
MKKYLSTLLTIFVCTALFSGCGTATEDKQVDDQVNPPDNKTEQVSNGQTSMLDVWEVAINGQSITQSVVVQGETKKDDGYVYVKVNMSAKNTSKATRVFMLGMCNPELDDLKGNLAQYELFVEGGLDKADCKPGDTATGDIFFKIPGDMNTNPAGMKLKFTYLGSKEQPQVEIVLK